VSNDTTIRIVSRYSSRVLFECEAPEGLESGLHMRHALEKAVASRANLTGANLTDAYLTYANLMGANLTDAYLAGANLTGANLTGANLTGANLTDANLAGANLAYANLTGANLTDAYLTDAYLAGANLTGANLAGANLTGAYLTDAYLAGAKWGDGIAINKAPIQLFGLRWGVTILDEHMQIGCQLHTLADWANYDDKRIAEMDGRDALRFWRTHKDVLLGLAKSAGRGVESEA